MLSRYLTKFQIKGSVDFPPSFEEVGKWSCANVVEISSTLLTFFPFTFHALQRILLELEGR